MLSAASVRGEGTKLELLLQSSGNNYNDLTDCTNRLGKIVQKLTGKSDEPETLGVRQGFTVNDGFIGSLEVVNYNTAQEAKELSDLIGILEELI